MYSHQAVALRIPGLNQTLSLYVHGPEDRHVSRCIREEGIWEPYETSLLLSLLGPGDVFLDVGANIGYFSVIAASLVGDAGSVFAFEPGPGNYRLLEASASLNELAGRIHAVEAGLAAGAGDARLYLSEDNLGDHQIFATDESRDSTAIQLLNGSDYLGSRLERIDLLKIDTQGSEYSVVEGLMPLIRGLPETPAILVELTPLSLRQCGASGRALVELLATLDQPMWIVDHIEHRLVPCPAQELAQWCDDVDAVPGDAGFMNILIGNAPAVDQPDNGIRP